MRKTWIGFAAALLFLHAAGSAASAAEITGDCNRDGACTIADAVLGENAAGFIAVGKLCELYCK